MNKSYPVFDITGFIFESSLIENASDLPIVNVDGKSFGFKDIERRKDTYGPERVEKDEKTLLNEVAFSKLFKTLDVRVANNHLAVMGGQRGVITEWFLNEGEEIKGLSNVIDLKRFLLPRPRRFQREKQFDKVIKKCEKAFKLHPDFNKNYIETYLSSVLMSNIDHRGYKNVFVVKDKVSGVTNMAPYHDLEFSTHTDLSIPAKILNARIIHGYARNIKYFKSNHKDVFEKFIDGLGSLDLFEISNFEQPHLKKFVKSERFLGVYSERLYNGIKTQIDSMKNF